MQVSRGAGAAPAAPISAAEFAERLAALGAPRRILIALSGGPDSTVLLRLAAGAGAIAVTVDHGLRAESRGEAESAGVSARAAGVSHSIVTWEGSKPSTGRQAAARNARYRLLAEFAEREGCEAILTGHTADDQAETVFMRLARGSGPSGLAGMEAATLIAAGAGTPVRLLRPLLAFPRERILATLAALGEASINDPSNDDPAYERVRTRALLAALEEQDLLTRDALVRTAARARAAANRIRASDEEWFNSHGGELGNGFASLAEWRDAPASLIARLIHANAGVDFGPSDEEADAALREAAVSGAATLGGAMLKRHRTRLFVFREPAAVLGRACVAPMEPLTLAPGASALWDARFIVRNEAEEGSVAVGPCGEKDAALAAARASEADAPVEAFKATPCAFRASPLEQGDLRLECLLEERFFSRVMRFP